MIQFKDALFKTRTIELPEFGEVLISTNSLNEILMDDEGAYMSSEAEYIDQNIFYFVEDHEIDLPEKKLQELLISEIR